MLSLISLLSAPLLSCPLLSLIPALSPASRQPYSLLATQRTLMVAASRWKAAMSSETIQCHVLQSDITVKQAVSKLGTASAIQKRKVQVLYFS